MGQPLRRPETNIPASKMRLVSIHCWLVLPAISIAILAKSFGATRVAASTTLVSELEGGKRATGARLEELVQEVARLGTEHLEALTLHNGLRVRLDGELRHLQRFDAELKALEANKRQLETTIEEETLARTQSADKLKSLSAQMSQLQDQLSRLLEDNPWIHDVYQYSIACPRG